MAFSDLENDAIGEATNIFAGAVACSFSNITDVDIDISIPYVEFMDRDYVPHMSADCFGFKFNFTSFTFGYCALVFEEDFFKFTKIFGTHSKDDSFIRHLIQKSIDASVEPLERLLDRFISVEVMDDVSKEWSFGQGDEDSEHVSVSFDVIFDNNIKGRMIVAYPIHVAKDLANRFIDGGIAVTTI